MSKGVVLVVDDEAQIRDILSFYLKRAGYQVLLAENGREALQQMSRLQPDLILSDLRMPEMPGDEFCRIVKGDPGTRDIYFMLVSAMDGSTSRIGGLNLGADDMISKPFHAQEVMAKVESAFRIIAMQKEIKRQNQVLTRFQERVTTELELAARLQMGLLPHLPGSAPGIHYTHRYLPAEGVGGDIYTVVPTRNGSSALLMADVSGHGVTAALISAMVKTSFDNNVRMAESPLEWVEAMNQDLARNTLTEQFATAFLARIDPTCHELRYICAGHDAPFYIPQGARGASKEPIPLRTSGFILGIEEGLVFQEKTCVFEPGDRLVLYTDGLTEVEREDSSILGEEGFLDYCRTLPPSADEAADQLVARVRDFNGTAPFGDDVTLVIVDRI